MKYEPYKVINLLEGDLDELIYIVPQLEGQSNVVLGAKDDEGTHAEMCIEIDDLIKAFEKGLKLLKELR